MEKINNIFLNYKTYSAFQRDLNAGKISPSSIAFIQDNRRIWAHGKEYACNGLSVVDNGEGSISFVDVFGNTVLSLSADPNGYINISGITGDAYTVFVTRGDFANYVEVVEQLKRDFEKFKHFISQLDKYIKIDQVDEDIDPDSVYPVQSRAIYQAFQDISDQLNSAIHTVNDKIDTKQDTLIAGEGIKIEGNTISAYGGVKYNIVTIPQAEYDLLVEKGLVDPNTYYFTYEQEIPSGNTWHFGEGFPIVLTDNWAFGGTFPITLTDRSTDSIGVLPITLT